MNPHLSQMVSTWSREIENDCFRCHSEHYILLQFSPDIVFETIFPKLVVLLVFCKDISVAQLQLASDLHTLMQSQANATKVPFWAVFFFPNAFICFSPFLKNYIRNFLIFPLTFFKNYFFYIRNFIKSMFNDFFSINFNIKFSLYSKK